VATIRAESSMNTPAAGRGGALGHRGPLARPQWLRVKLDPLRMALFGLILINVSRIHQHFGFLAKLRPALLLVALTGVYALLNPRFIRPGNLFQAWFPKVILALAALACIGAPFGISLGGSAMFILTDYSKVIVLAVLLIVGIRSTADLFALVWAYVISSGILAWLSLFVFKMSSAHSLTARLSHGYTFDANDIGLVLLVGFALTLLTLQTSSPKGKLVSGVILLAIGATIAKTGSRGAFLGFAAVGLVLLFTLSTVPLPKRLAFLGVTVAALVVAAPHGYWEQMKTLLNPTEDYNWQTQEGRKAVAERGLGYMLHYPVFGLGINNFWRAECIEGEKAKEHLIGTGLRCTPPHNSYVQAGAELGIPGLVLWCTLLFGSIRAMFKLRRRIPRAWARGDGEERFLYHAPLYLMLAMVAFSVTCLFLTFAWLDIVYMIAAFMTGLHISVRDKLRRSTPAPVAVAGRRPVRPASPFGPYIAPTPR